MWGVLWYACFASKLCCTVYVCAERGKNVQYIRDGKGCVDRRGVIFREMGRM